MYFNCEKNGKEVYEFIDYFVTNIPTGWTKRIGPTIVNLFHWMQFVFCARKFYKPREMCVYKEREGVKRDTYSLKLCWKYYLHFAIYT